MNEILLKTPSEIKIMSEGGSKLARVKKALKEVVLEGVSAKEIDDLADALIEKEGGKPSFKMVPGYHWATCINVNEGVVHGIPKKQIVFKRGDVVSIDVGLFYKGFHTDTSFTVGIEVDSVKAKFLETGRLALRDAISNAGPGKRIYDISAAIEKEITRRGYSPVRTLVGHGVGRALHEEPQIPCFTSGKREKSPEIVAGMTLAIEVMYAQGLPNVKLASDGWTITSSDGTITALFEESVAVTKNGPLVLTD